MTISTRPKNTATKRRLSGILKETPSEQENAHHNSTATASKKQKRHPKQPSTHHQQRQQQQRPPTLKRYAAADGQGTKDGSRRKRKHRTNANDAKKSEATIWNERIRNLKAYKAQYGNVKVPYHYADNLELGRWVSVQRSLYKKVQSGQSTPALSKTRIQQLNSLGFQWVCHNTASWDDRFHELIQFQAKHGHTFVNRNDAKNHSLGTWCGTQRYQFKKLQNGYASNITQDRIDKLNSIGFVWENMSVAASSSTTNTSHKNSQKQHQDDDKQEPQPAAVAPRKVYTSWEERFREWKEFCEQHGTQEVDLQQHPEAKGLKLWCDRMQANYQQWKDAGPDVIRQRLKQLKDAGFPFPQDEDPATHESSPSNKSSATAEEELATTIPVTMLWDDSEDEDDNVESFLERGTALSWKRTSLTDPVSFRIV